MDVGCRAARKMQLMDALSLYPVEESEGNLEVRIKVVALRKTGWF